MDARALLCTTHAKSPFFPKTLPKPSPFLPSDALRPKPRPCLAAVRSHKPRKFAEADAFPDSLPLHSKNPHAIYKDIRRFARLGHLSKALVILDYLEQRGIPVNVTTFATLLSACAKLKALVFGRQVHVHLRIHGLESNEFLLTKLVEMYAACGSPDDARRVFAELSPKSVYSWNALLRGNLTGGRRWEHAPLAVFSEMREIGVDANEYTFSCLIKSLAGSRAFSQGTKAHALLIKNGFAMNSVLLQTCLIDMYFKCGKVQLAMKLFDEITEKDIVLWGAVIAGFAHNGLRWEALKYFRQMGSEGIEPNSVIITTILPVIGELPERHLGREIHAFVLKRFWNYDKMVCVQSGLIDMYCKCGDMVSGRHVFYGSKRRNAVLWTALMSGYASNGRQEQALKSVVWMQQEGVMPDVVSIATAVPVCAQLKALRQGKEIHAYAVKQCFLPNVSISTSLMTMYSACGNLNYSCRLFDMMAKKNVLAWTALVDSYLKNDCPYDAFNVFRSMLQSNQRPDSIALARILSSCGEIGALKIGREVHAQVVKRKLESAPIAATEVVKMYGKCRDLEKARKVYDSIRSKGSLTCTAIIEAYGFNSRYKEALHLFSSMLSNGFVPNHYMFDAVLRICERANLVDAALIIFSTLIHEYDIKASEENYDCIINLLTHAGRINEAQKFIYLKSTLPSV